MPGNRLSASRHELKYVVGEAKARAIREFVRAYLADDPFSPGSEGYAVNSVYVDSLELDLYNQTARGQRNRFKLRVRYYDEVPAAPVYFEIKRRDGDVVQKRRAIVQRAAAPGILRGVVPSPLDLHEASGFDTLSEFCRLRDHFAAYDYTYVGYRREAYAGRGAANVRVTFDRHLVAAPYKAGQPLLVQPPTAMPPIGGVILELKFTERFPRWMHELVQTFSLQRQSVPKYLKCVDALRFPQRFALNDVLPAVL